MIAKRFFDLFFTIPGLIVLSPLFCIVALLIKNDSKGPVFFKQIRVGQYGKLFAIYKFRTMVLQAEQKGKQITIGADARINRSGVFLRKYKLDELPQLINVLKGEMSLVGPRPEVPRYVAEYPAEVKEKILSVPPGITDYASIEYHEENALLGKAENPEDFYIKEILPIKISYYLRYVKERNLWVDFVIILKTLKCIV